MSNKNILDQYYTNPSYAADCYEKVLELCDTDGKLLFEPCAGTGSFFNLMPKNRRMGIDLDPKIEGEGMCPTPTDFLAFQEPALKGCVVISNPPFGKNASLAVSFFNRCGRELEASTIAFIIPKTFKKASIQNRLDENYHLIFEEDSPKNSFILDGKAYNVPCCFQVWVRRENKRELIDVSHDSPHLSFVKKSDNPDVAIRRVGGNAGSVLEGLDHKEPSTYFIKIHCDDKEGLIRIMKDLDLTKYRSNTAGMNSVAKYELVGEIHKKLSEDYKCSCRK